MNIDVIKKEIDDFLTNSEKNKITEDVAFRSDIVGMKIYESSLLGVCHPDDEYIQMLLADKNEKEKKAFSMIDSPFDWLPEAQSIISFFLPFTDRVRLSNEKAEGPSDEWLHARIEGQKCLDDLTVHLVEIVKAKGFLAVAPSVDKRFKISKLRDKSKRSGVHLSSSWSERHIAFTSGLGTFSLSDSFISEKGAAGRISSLVTSIKFPDDIYYSNVLDKRGIYENCTNCGVCVKNCPVNAITIESGHDHGICARYLDGIKSKNPPYYGCGKCQTGVPCSTGIPGK